MKYYPLIALLCFSLCWRGSGEAINNYADYVEGVAKAASERARTLADQKDKKAEEREESAKTAEENKNEESAEKWREEAKTLREEAEDLRKQAADFEYASQKARELSDLSSDGKRSPEEIQKGVQEVQKVVDGVYQDVVVPVVGRPEPGVFSPLENTLSDIAKIDSPNAAAAGDFQKSFTKSYDLFEDRPVLKTMVRRNWNGPSGVPEAILGRPYDPKIDTGTAVLLKTLQGK